MGLHQLRQWQLRRSGGDASAALVVVEEWWWDWGQQTCRSRDRWLVSSALLCHGKADGKAEGYGAASSMFDIRHPLKYSQNDTLAQSTARLTYY